MKTLAALMLAAAVLLGGCYTSGPLLLDASQARHPFDDGVYARKVMGGLDRKRVTRSGDGWYQVEEIGEDGKTQETARVLFNTMTLSGGRDGYVFAVQREDGFSYGVAFAGRDGFYAAQPDCKDSLDRDAALDEGAVYDDDNPMQTVCRFAGAEPLMAALASFADHADFGAPYQPLK